MEIKLPAINEQQRTMYEHSTQEAIAILKENLNAPVLPGQSEIDESKYCNKHLLRKSEGWQAPHPDIVGAYFRQFQTHFTEYDSDKKLAKLLGLSSDRRIREFKQGKYKVPYEVWRQFLVLTGRAPQDIIKVFGFMAG